MVGGRGLQKGRGRSAQRGFGGFFMMFLLAALAGTTVLFSFARSDTYTVVNDRATADALMTVKAALIGYALQRGGPTGSARPGELPCPDTDPPGHANYGWENSPCGTLATPGSLIGRVPWKTLGIPEPKDGTGETLWYALSPKFRGTASNSADINTDTRGELVVRNADGTIATDNAVAVIIAPGASIGQNRGLVGTLACTLVGGISPGSVVPAVCANNYLDTAVHINNTASPPATTNNASASGPFIAGVQKGTRLGCDAACLALAHRFNDRLTYITTAELIPLVELRVGRELIAALQAYYKTNKFFPWTDNWPYSGGIADTGQSRGRYPSAPEPPFGNYVLPEWVSANDWHNFFWYTMSTGYTDGACKTCSFDPVKKVQVPVTLDGVAVKALIISPGMPLDGAARVSDGKRRDLIGFYFEDPYPPPGHPVHADRVNTKVCPDVGEIGTVETPPSGNFQGQLTCDAYETPTGSGPGRDRIYVVP